MQQTIPAAGNKAPERMEIFEYVLSPEPPCLPAWEGWGPSATEEIVTDGAEQPMVEPARAAIEAELRVGFDKRLAEETRRAFEAGRDCGREEGRQSERAEQASAQSSAEQRRTRQISDLIGKLAKERESYLQAVEPEVVQLALAVAARILRREAQLDPLLLTGAVRVALGQLAGSSEVQLRVPSAELDLWTEAMALLPNLVVKPTVLAGEEMRLGDCMIETKLGSVDLGIRSQMGEIERGFFDRAGRQRPAPSIRSAIKASFEGSSTAPDFAIESLSATVEAHS